MSEAAAVAKRCCRVDDDLPGRIGRPKGFPPAPGGFTGLVAVRQGDAVYVYVNSCPHIGTPLDWMPDRFLSHDGSHIICATHGAEFRIADGRVPARPVRGDRLEPVMIRDQGRRHLCAGGCRPVAAASHTERKETRPCQTSIPADGQVFPGQAGDRRQGACRRGRLPRHVRARRARPGWLLGRGSAAASPG